MFDVLIKNGIIIDGKQTKMFRGDVGIKGDRIDAIGDLSSKSATKVIDAEGQYVCPGFVDITNHSDTHWTIFTTPTQESFLRQGITTILGGSCGSSLAPLVHASDIGAIQKWTDISKVNINWLTVKEFLDELEKHPLGVNFGTLVGHGTLRRNIIGDRNMPADKEELEQMRFLLGEALHQGAYGLSFGLTFSHGRPAGDDELMALAGLVAQAKALCTIHLRDEGKSLLPAITEVLRIVRETGVSLEISHFKALGREAWGDLPKALHLIREGREEGLPIHADLFPYVRTGSLLYAMLPSWARDGGRAAILKRMDSPQERRQIIDELERATLHFERITIASAHREKAIIGKSLATIAENLGVSPGEGMLYILKTNELGVTIFGETIQDADIASILQEPYTFVSTDGFGLRAESAISGDLTHPRSFGTTARLLGEFVRDRSVVDWETAVHKMTLGPAAKMNLLDRGVIAPKAFADIVVLNPETIQDIATFTQPYQYPTGITWVLVNGTVAVEQGTYTGAKNGKILRK